MAVIGKGRSKARLASSLLRQPGKGIGSAPAGRLIAGTTSNTDEAGAAPPKAAKRSIMCSTAG